MNSRIRVRTNSPKRSSKESTEKQHDILYFPLPHLQMENQATESAHTPGPWVVRPNGEIKAHAWGEKWADYVCRMPFSSREEARELGPSHLPNAHIIAAAPDLLDACRLAVVSMKEALDGTSPGWMDNMRAD